MTAAVVDLVDPARRRLVLGQVAAVGLVQRTGDDMGAAAVGLVGQVFDRHGQREELAQRIPAQMPFLHELLHVLRRRAAGTGLEHGAAVQQRHDRQHLGAGAELEDREQVGQVVTQHVAGDGDRVLAGLDAQQRRAHGLDR